MPWEESPIFLAVVILSPGIKMNKLYLSQVKITPTRKGVL